MNEKFGVELELITKKFKNKMESTKAKVAEFARKTKEDFKFGMYFDTNDSKKQITDLKEQLADLKNQYRETFKKNGLMDKTFTIDFNQKGDVTVPESELRELQINLSSMTDKGVKEIDTLNQKIRELSGYLNSIETSKVVKAGKVFGNLKSKVEQVASSMKNAISGVGKKLKDVEKSSDDAGNSINNTFKKGLKSIKKFALSLFGIQSIWRAVSRASSAYLSQDVELSNKLSAVWIGLGSMLEPILSRLANWLLKLVGYLNAFIKGLTGVDLLAKAMDKANKNTKATASSVKALNGQLAGFDEINNIDTKDDSSSGASADTSWVDAFNDVKLNEDLVNTFTNAGQKINKAWTWFKENWKKIAIGLGAVAAAFLIIKLAVKGSNSIKTSSEIFSGFFNSLGKSAEIISILGGLALVLKEVAEVMEIFSESGMSVGEVALLLGEVIGELAIGFAAVAAATNLMDWQGIAAATIILGGFALIISQITELIDAFSKSGLKVSDVATLMASVFGTIVIAMGAIAGIAKFLCSDPKTLLGILALTGSISIILLVVAETLPTILEACSKFIKEIAPVVIDIIKTINECLNNTIYALGDVLPKIINELGETFDKIFTGIAKIVTSVGDTVSKIIESMGNSTSKVLGGIKNIIKQIGDTITQVAQTIVWFVEKIGPSINTFVDNMIAAITKLINFMISGIEYLVNTLIIAGVNKIIKAVNSVAEYVGIEIPTVPKMSIPRFVPKYETGTNYVPNDQLAYIHKGEAVVPKKFNSDEFFGRGNDETNSLIKELIEVIEEKDNNLYLDGKVIGKTAKDYISKQSRIMGRSYA